MSYNYFKLSSISIMLCVLIITHKFSLEHISHNNTNTVDIINAGHERLLSESQETDIFKTHSGENSMIHPIDNKLEEIDMEYNKTSYMSTLNDEIQQEPESQTDQIDLENENNNKLMSPKLDKKKHYKNIHKICKAIIILTNPLSSIYYISCYRNKKIKKKKKKKENEENEENKENEENEENENEENEENKENEENEENKENEENDENKENEKNKENKRNEKNKENEENEENKENKENP